MNEGGSLTVPEIAPVPDTSLPTGAARKVLFSAMKNEAPFVLEWVAYHKVIGFDEIVIAYNDCDDGTAELLRALEGIGWIKATQVFVSTDEVPQLVAARQLLTERPLSDGDWAIWLDADEFLNIHVAGHRMDNLIAALGQSHGLLINCRIFGDGGGSFSGRMLAEPFVKAASYGHAIKTLFQYGPHIAGLDIHRPRLRKGLDPKSLSFLTGSAIRLNVHTRVNRTWLAGISAAAVVSPPESGWALAQINHYSVRDRRLFNLKRRRGRGYGVVAAGNPRHNDDYYTANNLNDETDRTILRHVESVERVMAEAMQDEAVKAAVELVERRLATQLAESNPAAPGSRTEVVAVQRTDPTSNGTPDGGTDEGFELTFSAEVARFVTELYSRATNILEYGSGGSTVLAANLGKRVISVESDKAWADRLAKHLAAFPNAKLHHADIGPTAAWGMPARPRFHDRFHRYALSVWDRPDLGEPDLVLIDGRFRPACLVAVMLRAKRPTTVLFDDYENRSAYRKVERLARKEETVGRMARFTVTPGAIPAEMLTEVIGWFSNPR